MAKRRTIKPEAVMKLCINGHWLTGEKHAGKWVLFCPTWMDIAEQHNGTSDASDAIDEFTRRATGGDGEPQSVPA